MNQSTARFGMAALVAAAVFHGGIATAAEAAPADPFAQAARADQSVGGASARSNPFRPQAGDDAETATRAGDAAAAPSGHSAASADDHETTSHRAQCDQALLDARRALSVGDLPRAQQYLGRAEQLNVAYDAGSADSPQRVAESIQDCQKIAALRQTDVGGAAWRQAYGRFLATQADALLAWNDLDSASRAASEAMQLKPQLPAGAVTPQDVLRRIRDRRQDGNAAQITAASSSAAPPTMTDAKSQTLKLLAASRAALAAGNLAEAQTLAGKASALGVPDSQFSATEDAPARVAADIERARLEPQHIELSAANLPKTATPEADNYVKAALATREDSGLRMAETPETDSEPPSNGMAPPAPATAGEATPLTGSPAELLDAGEKVLCAGDRAGALQMFRAAYQRHTELDLLSQQRLQGHLQMLSVAPAAKDKTKDSGVEKLPSGDSELLNSTASGQSILARQLSAEIGKRQSDAAKIRETDPNKALTTLREGRQKLEESDLNESLKGQLLRRVDMSLAETEKYIKDHKADLELDAANKKVLDDIERDRVVKVEITQRTAEMVDQFNKLLDQQRFAEAEVVAKRLYDMAPDEPVAQQVWRQAKMVRRERQSKDIDDLSENGVANSFLDTRRTAAEALANSNTPMGYDQKTWDAVKDRRAISDLNSKRNVKEIEIEQKLRTPVLPKYEETPLSKVVEGLSQLAGVNIHLDPRGLSQEGVRSDTPVTLNLPQEISLKSALTLILEPLHLTYTVKDEVLKITSEQIRDGDLKIHTYPVGDLVVPIPNFVPNNNIGLQGLINDAYHAIGYGPAGGVPGPMAVVAGTRPGQVAGPLSKNALAQQMGGPHQPSMGALPTSANGSSGPGGLGGAAQADFDSLIDLITSTVEHDSWMENGTGQGEIQPFPTNLSLVISQTQRVHEQIADLLEQLRRLQDLQVTIEVRFIRLTDNFFERIGVDFDFNIQDKTGIATVAGQPGALFPGANFAQQPNRPSATVGLQFTETGSPTTGFPNYTVDLDLPFRQGSFGLATPQFGTPAEVGSFGFAILSDIEAFFLVEASQGDRRANVLQAPKVTLFNGQQAVVVDSSFVPFVISVVPVVGEFAAAQQPVIVVLSEGTMMTVQAVVSDDRRYVRLTLVPFFSTIGDVREFTFEGSQTTSSSSNTTDSNNDGKEENNQNANQTVRSGTTVQLPTFQVISVSTTVSVPDGGTVLLGGIKRLREGRNEFGVPLLSKVPYIDRLFRNVGIGRETDSLMMMVTPHIIIQEEEEERLGVATE